MTNSDRGSLRLSPESPRLVKQEPKADAILQQFFDPRWCIQSTELDYEQEKAEYLGEGSISHVFKANLKHHDVAVKILRMDNTGEDSSGLPAYCADLVDELAIASRRLDHPNVTQFIAAGTVQLPEVQVPFIVYEYLGGGSVEDLLDRRSCEAGKTWVPPRSLSLSWCQQMLNAIAFLHGCNTPFAHRDIKPANLLLSEDLQVLKLADFSLATPLTDANKSHAGACSLAGSLRYMAPEVASREAPIDLAKADVYSAAMTAWCMIFGKRPFCSVPHAATALRMATAGIRPQLPAHSDKRLSQLLTAAWATAPSERPTASDSAREMEAILEKGRKSGWKNGLWNSFVNAGRSFRARRRTPAREESSDSECDQERFACGVHFKRTQSV